MKLHIITIGQPKLAYAQQGWQLYTKRLERQHSLRISHLPDKAANDSARILQAAGRARTVGLIIDGQHRFDSHSLATWLDQTAQQGQEACFLIGGPDGLPPAVQQACSVQWSLSDLTFPHDLAMVIVAEALYRASTINSNHPYHH